MYKKYNNPGTLGNSASRCATYPWCDREENEEDRINHIDLRTTVSINQTANSTAGDGGDGGDARGGDASQATGLIAISANEIDAELEIPRSAPGVPVNGETSTVQPLQEEPTGASGGDAAGGEGGNGGNATSSNTATVSVDVENVVVIANSSDGPPTAFTIGTRNRNLEIRVDENGDTFVNGKKMEEQALEDGTKVMIFKDSQVKNS
ncbi:MAG: hypothetical protein AAGU76_05825 [Sedimentibacter sp.]|uniref:hypothetical protein n=1 Tax=Sedimentibacter sp. TaxID=1960295 RepID=UPI003158A732